MGGKEVVACGCAPDYKCPDCSHCFACEHEAIYTPGGWTWRHPVYIGWWHWRLRDAAYYYNATTAHKYIPHFHARAC